MVKYGRVVVLTAVWIVVRVILFILIPALLAYLSADKSFIDILKDKKILGEGFNVPLAKQAFLVTSIGISNFILVAMYEFKNYKLQLSTTKNIALIHNFKTEFLSTIAIEVSDRHFNSVKIRVWKGESKFILFMRKIKCNLRGQTFNKAFCTVEINGLSDIDSTNGLSFEVFPLLQGLVGKCYDEHVIKYEEDISNLNALYNLTSYQISKTRNTKFCLTVPLFNNRNEISAIISFDCIYPILIPQSLEGKVADMFTTFTQELSKYYPRLFK
jgi:hypothetical protein